MGRGCLVSQPCSPGDARIGCPRQRLPTLWAVDDVGSSTANRHRVQISRVCVWWPRRRGPGRGRVVEDRRRLQALVKACLDAAGGAAGSTAPRLTPTVFAKRDAGAGLAAGAESTQQPWSWPGGRGRGAVASSLIGGPFAAPVTIEHVHLSNNPLQPTAGGRCGVDSSGACARRG